MQSTTDPIEISQSFVLRIPLRRIRSAALSFDHALLNGRAGIDLLTRKRGYPSQCLRSPSEHLSWLTERGAIGSGPVITQTYRNCPQNPRCPLYTRHHGLCETASEEVTKSERPYYGLAHFDDGAVRGLAMDFRKPVPPDVRWWAAGIPVLWDGEIAHIERLVPEVADFCHLWRLQLRGSRRREVDVENYRRLSTLFHDHTHAPAVVASRVICTAAEQMGLQREHDYLHNAVGVGPEHLVIVMAHGSLEHLGELAQKAGATHAVVVDNGGSCQVAWRRSGPGSPLLPLAQSFRFREPTITLAAYELEWSDALAIEEVAINSIRPECAS